MIYFIITTSLYNNCDIRRSQYICGITKLKKVIQDLNITNSKVIIVENNGPRKTFLDYLDCPLLYTNNNFIKTTNKGIKELQDVLDCIDFFKIQDNDFIVKMTGRYILNVNSKFMNALKNLYDDNSNLKYDCILRYGSFYKPVNYRMNDCITGLIGMSCSYVKKIEKPNEVECVEWKWAKITNTMDESRICMLDHLGINICPGSNDYFLV